MPRLLILLYIIFRVFVGFNSALSVGFNFVALSNIKPLFFVFSSSSVPLFMLISLTSESLTESSILFPQRELPQRIPAGFASSMATLPVTLSITVLTGAC